MREFQVRCCCDPDRVFGYLKVPDFIAAHAKSGFRFRLNILAKSKFDAPTFATDNPLKIHTLALEFGTIAIGDAEAGVAIKSMDYPLELFRLLPGFREAGT